MNYIFQRESICNGVQFSSVTDTKFKHNRITVQLVTPLEQEKVSANAIVPFLLRKGCESCPDFTQLNRRLCALYGASLSCDVSKYGGYQVLELSIYGIDDRYTLEGEAMVSDCAKLLTEILMSPHLVDGIFPCDEVEIEKQQVIDAIESLLNDKRAYAVTRCRSILCEGEAMNIEKYGQIDEARKMDAQKATAAYRRLMEEAQIEIIFVGGGDPATAKEIFSKAFSEMKRRPILAERTITKTVAKETRELTEALEVAQGKLVLGFRTGEIKDAKTLMAVRMMVTLYGGTPNSRLFSYVREKLSLCYYCAARFDRLSGLMFVDSGVEIQNKQKAQDEILNQLECVRKGEFTDEEITATRMIMQTSLKAVEDSLGAIEDWYMTQIMYGTNMSPIEESKILDEVTREDIIAAANRVTLGAVYFLTGKENSDNE